MRKSLNIQLLTAAILSLGGLALLFCGVCIDPQGEIHESLLIGFGEVATFVGAIMGVDYRYRRWPPDPPSNPPPDPPSNPPPAPPSSKLEDQKTS